MKEQKQIEILLAEDNPGDARLTLEAFKEWKLANEIHVVSDGEEALSFLYRKGTYTQAPRPDLILLDLNMPKKGGAEVLADIKSNDDLKRIPTIILTTSKAEQDIFRAYNLHANSYIEKPVEFEKFIDAVKTLEHYWFAIVKRPF